MTRSARRAHARSSKAKAAPRGRRAPRTRGPVPRKASNWLHARIRAISRGQHLRSTMAGVLGSIALVAVLALWLTGGLGSALQSTGMLASNSLRAAGFGLAHIDVVDGHGQPVSAAGVRAVRQALAVEEGELVFSINLAKARERVENLGWVSQVRIVRALPDRLTVIVTERQPFALWQSGGAVHVIGANGVVIAAADPAQHAGLPLAVGDGAASALPSFLNTMQHYPRLASRVQAYVRVGGRRWNLRLDNGTDLMLPARAPETVLALVERDAKAMAVLDRPGQSVDARLPGRLYVRARAGAGSLLAKAPARASGSLS